MRKTMPKHGVGLLWSSRQISTYFSWAIIGYVTFFCSDYLGLSTGIVGTMLLASKILDAISNFVIAYIIDNTHFKQGKGRPWEISVIPYWITLILLFCVPAGWGNAAKYVAVFVFYSLNQAVFGTFLGCVDTIYFKRVFKDEDARNKAQVLTSGLSTIAMLVGTILLPVLIAYFSTIENGWRIMALILGVPMAVIGSLRFLLIPETTSGEGESNDHVSIKDTIQAFLGNKYVLIITLMYFGMNFYNSYANAPTTYYTKWILGDISLGSVLSAVGMISIVILPFCVPIANKFGRIKPLRFFFMLTSIACLLKFFAGTNLTVLCVLTVIAGLFAYPFNAYSPLMLIDTMDYGHWKNGKVVEGAIFAATGLGSTIGNGVGSALSGVVLAAFGYDGTAAEQTAQALLGIRVGYAIVPAVMLFVIFILLHFYDLEEKMPQIKADLEQRKGDKS
ncbi:MAG: MFS transporter [Clostridiales bacterium]|nr:MFS transporter [Clostridiales bacterium]